MDERIKQAVAFMAKDALATAQKAEAFSAPDTHKKKKLRARYIRMFAANLRANGNTYKQIGMPLGVSGSRAWQLVKSAVKHYDAPVELLERQNR